MTADVQVRTGDSRVLLGGLAAGSVQCCVTSPPYFGLRDYGVDGQMGREASPVAYVAELVALLGSVRRVLADDGTLWLNLGDSYANPGHYKGNPGSGRSSAAKAEAGWMRPYSKGGPGLKNKDLLMIPARVALALQADGWWLRSDIIWHKPNPMPERVTDRPTSAHEHVFLLTKRERYFYAASAIREPFADARMGRDGGAKPRQRNRGGRDDGFTKPNGIDPSANGGRNSRNVWTLPPTPFKGKHCATMPVTLAERCILAGSRPGDTVLDPFGGVGTTGLAAQRLGRSAVLLELNPAYADTARIRIKADALQGALLAAA